MKLGFAWTYARRSLIRGGLRTALAVASIVVGILAIVSLQLVGSAIYQATAGNIRVATGGDISVDASYNPLTTAQLAFFAQLQQQGKLSIYSPFAQHEGVATTTTGARLDYFDWLAVDPATFPPGGGTIFTDFTEPAGATIGTIVHGERVAVSQGFLGALHAHLGDRMTLVSDDGRTAQATIAGVFEDTAAYSYIQNGPYLLYDAANYGNLPDATPTAVTYTNVFADVPGHRPDDAATVAAEIQDHFPISDVQSTRETSGFFQSQSAGFQHFFQIVALLALLIGGVAVSNTLTVLLRRRLPEIAILKTLGYRGRDLMMLIGLEAVLLGLVGGIIGAVAGVGADFVISPTLTAASGTPIPTTIDPTIVLAGVAIGVVTAVIFGIIPIVQSATLRPMAILRGIPEGQRAGNWAKMGGLFALVVALFGTVAANVLGDAALAAVATVGACAALLLLGIAFAIVFFLVGRTPIRLLNRRTGGRLNLTLNHFRHQGPRAVTTAVALFIGTFAIGVILLASQDLQDEIAAATANISATNAYVTIGQGEKDTLDATLAHLPGVQRVTTRTTLAVTVSAIRGVSVERLLTQQSGSLPGQAKHDTFQALQPLSRVEGYALGDGYLPDPHALVLTTGANDTHIGRNLGAADAGTHHLLAPLSTSQAPLNLRLGDTITVQNTASGQSATFDIIGFYQPSTISFDAGTIVGDSAVLLALGGDQASYFYALRLAPGQLDSDLQMIQAAIPEARTQDLTNALQSTSANFNKVALGLAAVASLALFAGLIGIANTVALSLFERRREMGILKSLGYTSRHILSDVLLESGILAGTSAVVAVALAAALITAISSALTFNGTANTYQVSPLIIAGTLGLAVALSLVIAIIVARGSVRVRPLEVLRYE